MFTYKNIEYLTILTVLVIYTFCTKALIYN